MVTKILGDNMQALIMSLDKDEKVFAEAGSMMYIRGNVEMEAEMQGGLMGGIKRMFSGESLFMTTFKAGENGGEVGFASPFPGKLQQFKINGTEILCQRDAFLCCTEGVKVDIALTKKLGAGFFGGEGFILESLTGNGEAYVHAGGNFVELELPAGESIRVDTGCIVAFENTIDYDIKFVGGLKRTLFGGEGLFFAYLTGPGKVYLQTLPFSRMATRIWEAAGGNQGEKAGLRSGDLVSQVGGSIIKDMFGR
jgi:uncharacterized protein (TIGR00266 family)